MVVIVIPTVLLAAAFGFVGWALSRYVGALRTAHDALHLAPAWKRRHPPGVAAGHKDRWVIWTGDKDCWRMARVLGWHVQGLCLTYNMTLELLMKLTAGRDGVL